MPIKEGCSVRFERPDLRFQLGQRTRMEVEEGLNGKLFWAPLERQVVLNMCVASTMKKKTVFYLLCYIYMGK